MSYRKCTSLALIFVTMQVEEKYMWRCLQLAAIGAGNVAPNPMVGAVLVHEGKIIGEGFHQRYGESHAEVNCIQQAIDNGNGHLLMTSTLYVSLEPCAHEGKTPPCTDLILKHKIPRVIVGSGDPNEQVNGKGIERLRTAGVEVTTDVLAGECDDLNKRFFIFHQQHRPYIILKWAQSIDGKIARNLIAIKSDFEQWPVERLMISNDFTNRMVHKWRSEEAAILVGTNTALLDNPSLTTRYCLGNSPVRLVIDLELKLPATLNLFDRQVNTIVFNSIKNAEEDNLIYYKIENEQQSLVEILDALFQMNIQSVIVEGGAKLLQSFIDARLWDEARIITNTTLRVGNGLAAPQFAGGALKERKVIALDIIEVWANNK